jgi:AraC-like DNA-binding protein
MSRTITNAVAPVLEKRDALGGIITPADGDRPSPARYSPSADLATFVAYYWLVQWDVRGPSPLVRETLPHPCVHLTVETDRSAVYGVVKGRFTRALTGEGRVFGVRFRAGGFYPFVKSPLSRLTNRTVPITDIFGPAAQAFEADVRAEAHDAGLVALADTFLRRVIPTRDAMAEAMGAIVDRIAADRAMTTVDALVRAFGYGTRSLQRHFARYVGVSPKWVINRYRLQEAIGRVDAGETLDWTRLALDLGYFDHAHFIRDFRTIIGCTPLEYAKRATRSVAGPRPPAP